MARAFSGSGQYMSIESTAVNAAPFSVAAWVYSTNNTGNQCIWTHANNGGSTFHGWYFVNASGTLRMQTFTGTTGNADATTGVTTGVWYHALGVTAAADSRAVYMNGTNKGTNTTSSTPVVATPRVGIGCWDVGGGGELWNGRIACVTLWDVALDDTDATILAAGIHPFLVKPQSIINHWELMGRYSPEIDMFGTLPMTLTGPPTQIDHPRIYGVTGAFNSNFGEYVPFTSSTLQNNLLFPKEMMRRAI